MEAQLAAMVNLLHDLRDSLDEAVPEGELNYLGDLSAQAASIAAAAPIMIIRFMVVVFLA